MLPDFRLIDAIKVGISEEAVSALRDGANIHLREYGKLSVLRLVERSGANELVKLLVRNGADPNEIIDKQGNTLLHHAARYGNLGFASALLENGADVNLQNLVGKTPLHVAVSNSQGYMAQLLLKYRANAAIPSRQGETALQAVERLGEESLAKLLREERGSLSNHAASSKHLSHRTSTDQTSSKSSIGRT